MQQRWSPPRCSNQRRSGVRKRGAETWRRWQESAAGADAAGLLQGSTLRPHSLDYTPPRRGCAGRAAPARLRETWRSSAHEMRTQRSRARKSRPRERGTEQMRRCPVQQAACTSRRLQVGWRSDGRNSGSRLGQSRSARLGRHVANVRAGCSSVAVLRVGWDRMLQGWPGPSRNSRSRSSGQSLSTSNSRPGPPSRSPACRTL